VIGAINTYLESLSPSAMIKESRENSLKGTPHTKMVLKNERTKHCSRRQNPWCLRWEPYNIYGHKLSTHPISSPFNHPLEQILEWHLSKYYKVRSHTWAKFAFLAMWRICTSQLKKKPNFNQRHKNDHWWAMTKKSKDIVVTI
jgi:hypothetical protein